MAAQPREYLALLPVPDCFSRPSRTRIGRIASSLRWSILDLRESSGVPNASLAFSSAVKIDFLSSSATGLPSATGRDGTMGGEVGLLVACLGDAGVAPALPIESATTRSLHWSILGSPR